MVSIPHLKEFGFNCIVCSCLDLCQQIQDAVIAVFDLGDARHTASTARSAQNTRERGARARNTAWSEHSEPTGQHMQHMSSRVCPFFFLAPRRLGLNDVIIEPVAFWHL